jgi:hypothetical protein
MFQLGELTCKCNSLEVNVRSIWGMIERALDLGSILGCHFNCFGREDHGQNKVYTPYIEYIYKVYIEYMKYI